MMLRRTFVAGMAATVITMRAPEAQQTGTVLRVGVLSGSAQVGSPRGSAFLAGLHDFGYVHGRSVTVEWRASGGDADRLPDLAKELVRFNTNVIVAVDNPAIAAAQKATRLIPIVMVAASDPVATGFVASLARPGGNTTGLTAQATDLQGKALELLSHVIPTRSRIAIVWNPAEPGRRATAREAEIGGSALGLRAELLQAANKAQLESIFAAMTRDKPDAVLIQPSQTNFVNREWIAERAKKLLLPTMGWSAETVESGWLMSYGPNIIALYRRAGYYVDKVLKGAKPADLPIEQPTKFEFVVNVKTAKALGLTIPPSLLLRADRVIE